MASPKKPVASKPAAAKSPAKKPPAAAKPSATAKPPATAKPSAIAKPHAAAQDAGLAKALTEAQAELAAARSALDDHKQTAAATENNLALDLAATRRKLDEALAAATAARGERDQAQAGAAAARGQSDQANARAERQQVELERLRADIGHASVASSNEAQRLDEMRRELEQARGDLEAARGELAAYRLRCPKCGKNFAEEQYEGISIDRCTGCDAIYFDAGEVDQLLAKVNEKAAEARTDPEKASGWFAGLFRRKPRPAAPSGDA